jgi:hypothetical protein
MSVLWRGWQHGCTAYISRVTICAAGWLRCGLLELQASQYKIPIYITETGIADKKDGNRSHMIDEYMRAVSNPSPLITSTHAAAHPETRGCLNAVCMPTGTQTANMTAQ